jgi:HEAT repeat protein
LGDWVFPQTQKGTYGFAEEISQLGSNSVPVLLEKLAADRSPMVREISAMTLGNLYVLGALPLLTNTLARDAGDKVREAAVDALGEIDDAAALPALLQAMRADTNSAVRASAVRAASRLGGAAVVSELLATGRQESDWEVRARIARALANARESQAIPLFTTWLNSTPANQSSSQSTAMSFGSRPYQVGQIIEAVGELGGEPAYQFLTNYWLAPDAKESRESLCRAFGAMRDPRALPLLLQTLDEETETRAAAAAALGELGDTNALPALLALVEDKDQQVRQHTLTAVGRLGQASAVPTLLKALESDVNRDLRAEICEALGLIADPTAVDPILAVLSNQPKNRDKIFWALGHLGHTNAVPALASALFSPERDESFAAAYALVEIGGGAAADALAVNLAHKDEFARHAKACALTMLGRTNGLPTVLQSVVAKEPWRRFGAILALAPLGLPPDAAEWKPALLDRDPALRQLAHEAAAGRIVLGLVELLKDQDGNYREYAARGLLFFRDPASLPALQEACRDQDAEVRMAAELAVNFIRRSPRLRE